MTKANSVAVEVLRATPRHTRKQAARMLHVTHWHMHRLAREKCKGAHLLSDWDVEVLADRKTKRGPKRGPQRKRGPRGSPVRSLTLAKTLKANLNTMIQEVDHDRPDQDQGGPKGVGPGR